MRLNYNEVSNPSESHRRNRGSSSQSRILDIERAQRAEFFAVIQRAERLYSSRKSLLDAVLKRMGFPIQQDTLLSPQPPASPTRSPGSSLRGRRPRPILNNDKRVRTSRANQALVEEEPFYEKKLRLGRKMAGGTAANRSPSRDSSFRSVNMHTPTELRAISHTSLFTPTPFPPPPPPPPRATRRPSRLPVIAMKFGGAGKEVANGCKLQSSQTTLERLTETLEKFMLRHRPSPELPTAPSRTPMVAPKVPAPPSEDAPPNRKGPRRGTKCNPKAVAGQEDLQPLVNPAKSLSLCFTQLTSDNWQEKLHGLKSVRVLARHHPEYLQTKLHEVCLVLTEAVNNPRSAVTGAAMGTVAELHAHLGRAMDTEAEWTGRVLLLKLAQTTNSFIHQQANLALDALVEGCSPGRIINVLLNIGLSHRCAAVRGSTAEHLHQLADIVGEDQLLTAGKIFTERFLVAVSKMAVDPAPEVRHYGQKMLKGLAHQKEFTVQWDRIIPVKDRHHLEKILKKMRQ
ncbi:TOG array regulator of axonemal microtubules protein 1-like [Perca flavescens]|uniref:TOG array regulator of axonemal microtubules protein 1-like n=1 Tax=Perca flavescens TaxID=8167 RepID=UPI00106ED036|nr:TOG array regulator of axonemal microtubules protein 1-like [Perca flavescens]